MKKKDVIYSARIIPNVGIYEVCELTIRTVGDTWFSGVDKRDKHVYLFSNSEIDKKIFYDRKKCLKVVKEAEKHKKIVSDEIYYEDY